MDAHRRLNKIRLSLAICATATMLLGSLDHFIYEWSNGNWLAGLLFAANESVWEHIKLALFPMLVFSAVGGFVLGKKVNNYFLAVFCGIITMVFFIIFAFFGYTFFARRSILPLDISIFAIAIGLGYAVAYLLFFAKKRKWLNVVSIIGIIGLWALFLTMTYRAPDFFLFKELFMGIVPKYC